MSFSFFLLSTYGSSCFFSLLSAFFGGADLTASGLDLEAFLLTTTTSSTSSTLVTTGGTVTIFPSLIFLVTPVSLAGLSSSPDSDLFGS